MKKIDRPKLIVVLSIAIATIIISASVAYAEFVVVHGLYTWDARTNDFGNINLQN
jgi:hypothetical protein